MENNINDLLKKNRDEKGLTQVDVAKLVGCAPQYYNEIENGKRRPGIKTAKRIGRTLGVDWVLFYGDDLN